MLFCNKVLYPRKRAYDFGVIHQVAMGMIGPNCKLISLTCPERIIVEQGLNTNLTIGTTRSGKPKIISKKDNDMYLLLSAEGDVRRMSNGYIKVLASQYDLFQIIAKGNGAYGRFENIKQWPCCLIKAPSTTAFVQVRKFGEDSREGFTFLYVIHEGRVVPCSAASFGWVCKHVLKIEMPFKIISDGSDGIITQEEWVSI